MQKPALILMLALFSATAWGGASCMNGTNPVCLDVGDKICPDSAKCVGDDVVCFDKHTCAAGTGLICESEYDRILSDYKKTVQQHDELAVENVALREERLGRKNCVINAPTLEAAESCVR